MGSEGAKRAEPSPAWVLWPFEGPRAGQTSGAEACSREGHELPSHRPESTLPRQMTLDK